MHTTTICLIQNPYAYYELHVTHYITLLPPLPYKSLIQLRCLAALAALTGCSPPALFAYHDSNSSAASRCSLVVKLVL